ncbi:MAG: DMT family transporter [Thermoplasmatales archaeon]|nr:MAG: DMT family transporter [Thermoplasmatales archaeon]
MSDYDRKKEVFTKKYFFLIIGMPIVFWAFAFPLIKIGLEELSPVNLTIMRLLIACIIFLILLPTIPNNFSKLHKKDILPIFLLGFTGIVIYHLGLNYGEQYISPSVASLIIATIPIFVVVLAVMFLKEKITLKVILGVILSLVGVVIISIIGKPDILIEINYMSGVIAVLIGAIVGAGYTVVGKKMLYRYSALSLTVYAFLFGSLGLIPFISISLFEEVVAMSITGWSIVIFLGIFSTVISYVLWYVALEIKSASKISVYLYFIPLLSTIISFILFQDKITWFFIFGGTLVILGLYIVNKQRIETT